MAPADQAYPSIITDETRPFWEGAARGELIVERCRTCHRHIFPLRGVCRFCWCRDLDHVSLSGPGVIYSFTINHQRWTPDAEVPSILALVDFPEEGVRVLARLREWVPDQVAIGGRVDIGFEPGVGGVFFPSFVPVATAP